MIAGTQAMSTFNSPSILADKVVEMADAILRGVNPPINDTSTYDNYVTGIIPSYICEPVIVTADNYKEFLIDTGYYDRDTLSAVILENR